MTRAAEPISGELLPVGGPGPGADVVGRDGSGLSRERIAGAWLVAQDSDNTVSAYRTDITEWFAWCDRHGVAALAPPRAAVDAYRRWLVNGGNGRQLVRSTIARNRSSQSSFYRYGPPEFPTAVPGNPVDRAKRPQVGDVASSTWLTRDEVEQLFAMADATGPWEAALVRVLCYTGVRVSELCRARTRDLERRGRHRTLTVVKKGGRSHTVPLPADADRALTALLGGRSGHIFLSRRGEPVTRQEVAYRLGKLVRGAGIDKEITPHCLRHTAATLARESGHDVREVQQLLGHRRIETTLRYEHARLGVDQSAAHGIADYITGAR